MTIHNGSKSIKKNCIIKNHDNNKKLYRNSLYHKSSHEILVFVKKNNLIVKKI